MSACCFDSKDLRLAPALSRSTSTGTTAGGCSRSLRSLPTSRLLAYVLGPSVGAAAYNLLHNLVLPIALGTASFFWDSDWGVAVALIWLTHIGVDRLVGYGLKYPTSPKDTHLQRV